MRVYMCLKARSQPCLSASATLFTFFEPGSFIGLEFASYSLVRILIGRRDWGCLFLPPKAPGVSNPGDSSGQLEWSPLGSPRENAEHTPWTSPERPGALHLLVKVALRSQCSGISGLVVLVGRETQPVLAAMMGLVCTGMLWWRVRWPGWCLLWSLTSSVDDEQQ